MKIKSLILAMAVCFGFTACSSDDENTPTNGGEGDAYASFSFVMPNASSGANSKADPATGDKVAGSVAESYMTEVTLLFYTDGKLKETKTFQTADFSSVVASGGDALYTKKANFTITTGTYKVYAFVNPTSAIKALAKESDISAIEGAATIASPDDIATDKKFVMNNAETAVPVKIDGTLTSPTVIKINVERAAVKIVDATPTTEFTTTGGAKAGSKVIFSDMALVNQNKSYYNLKRVGDATATASSIVIGGAETAANYVIDPNFTSAKPADFFNPISTTATFAGGLGKTFYCAENTANIEQSKKANITTIIYKAKFVPKDVVTETDGTFYVFGGLFYGTTAEIKAAIGTTADVSAWTVAQWKAEGVEFYKGGICYYNAYLRHAISSESTIGIMEYGVVRNNVYLAKVTSVKGLGTTEPGEDPDPKTDDTYAIVAVQVMPWTVRVNNFDL